MAGRRRRTKSKHSWCRNTDILYVNACCPSREVGAGPGSLPQDLRPAHRAAPLALEPRVETPGVEAMIAVGQDPDVLAGLEALETDRALALNEGQGGVERERVSEKKKKKTGTLGVGSRLQDGLTFISAAHLKGTFLSCPGFRPAGLWPLPSTSTETPVLAVPSASLVGYEYLALCPAALVTLSRAWAAAKLPKGVFQARVHGEGCSDGRG